MGRNYFAMMKTKFTACFAILAVCAPAAHAQVEIPNLTQRELRCQVNINEATENYVRSSFTIRRDCFNMEMSGALGLEVDCTVNVDENNSTGDPTTDELLRRASARLQTTIAGACINSDLEILGFPGFCPAPEAGRAFDVFDLNGCLLDSSYELVEFLMDYEQPEVEEVFSRPDRACRDTISEKSSRLFTGELTARQTCLMRQLKGKVPPTVDCRLEESDDDPGTGDKATDDAILSAHDSKLRALSGTCRIIYLNAVGFPNLCPSPEGNVYPLTALRECMFASHHFDMIRFLDVMNPLTSKCGNGDLDFTEQCDDGDNITEPGKLCKFDCSINDNCGDPLGTGVITLGDALFVLRASIGLESCDLALCDVNGSGYISTTDAFLLLQYVTELQVSLDCPDPISLTCGNAVLDRFEQCDDGDVLWTLGEECNASCLRLDCGDANDSGELTVTDANLILSAASALLECDDTVCDVNGDGTINTTDSLIVLHIATGFDQPVNCPMF